MTVIPVSSSNTVTSLAHRGTVPHRRLDFFYSNNNNSIQLEDTTIKTERCCSMQCTDRTRVSHHSSLGLHLSWPDLPRHSFPEYNAVTVGKSGAIWTGAGGLTLSRSQTSFQNSIFALYSYRARYACAARMNQCFVLFAGSEHSMCNDAQSRLADIIYGSQTEQAGCDEWQSRIKMECECDVLEGRSTRLSFFLFFVLCLSYHFQWQTVSNLFIFLCCSFHCVNSKMLN